MTRFILRVFSFTMMIVVAGCADGAEPSGESASSIAAEPAGSASQELEQLRITKAADGVEVASFRSIGRASPPAPRVAGLEQAAPLQIVAPTGAMLIRTGESRLEVDSLELSIAAVERAAASVDGWIAESSVSLGEHEYRSGRLVIRVPADRWDELVTGLRTIGEPRHFSTSTQDVGEQFVDLNAQLANAQRVETRYLELLRTRTGSLEDLLAVERELSRVRERIETLQGRLRYLGERVAVSTMVVHLDQRTTLLATPPGPNPLREALRDAWANFIGVIAAAIAMAGGLLPIVVPLGVIGWAWKRRRMAGA